MRKFDVVDFSHLSQTTLMNLYIRGSDFKAGRTEWRDEQAQAMLPRIDYDFASLRVPDLVRLGTILRSEHLDRMTAEFTLHHPRCVIVNLGAGLDRRRERVPHAGTRWYDLDVPSVIRVRKQFVSEDDEYSMIAADAFRTDWLGAVRRDPRVPLLVLAEGVLMYFPKHRVKRLLLTIAERLGEYTLFCDIPSRVLFRVTWFYPTLRRLETAFRWGVYRTRHLETWSPKIKVESTHRYLVQANYLLKDFWYLKRIPFMGNLSRIVRLRVGG